MDFTPWLENYGMLELISKEKLLKGSYEYVATEYYENSYLDYDIYVDLEKSGVSEEYVAVMNKGGNKENDKDED